MRVLITGGCGFIGLASARALRAQAHDVRLLSSRRAGEYEGFEVVRGDVRDPNSLSAAVDGMDAAVIAHQFPGFPIERPQTHDTFQEVDAEGTRHVITALRNAGQARSVVYLSGAAVREDAAGVHPGIDAKLEAERAVCESGIPWTILRASIVYGPGDHIVSRFADMVKHLPVVPLPGDGRALAEPIHVDDLAQAVAAAVASSAGLLDACGPDVLSTNALVYAVMHVLGRPRPILHLPLGMLAPAAAILERLPNPPLTRGLLTFSQFANTRSGLNADTAFGLTFRPVNVGIRQVYGTAAL